MLRYDLAKRAALAALSVILSLLAAQAHAQASDPLTEDAAEWLRTGQYVWAADRDEQAPVTIVVSVSAQMAYVYQGSELIGVSTVSTGRRGHSTPLGGFTILQKQLFHRSNLYSNAPMPFMQRLTWSGIAMHAGQLPGYPASHGCIRLPRAFAEWLFGVARLGSPVIVTDYDARLPTRTLSVATQYFWADESGGGGPGTARDGTVTFYAP